MKMLTANQISNMLEEMSPAQVRANIDGRLQPDARQLLEQAEREEQETDAMIAETARVFNENLPPAPPVLWPVNNGFETIGGKNQPWWKRTPSSTAW